MAVAVGTSITELVQGRKMEDDAPSSQGWERRVHLGVAAALQPCCTGSQNKPSLSWGHQKEKGKVLGVTLVLSWAGASCHGPMDPSITRPTRAVWQCFGTCMDLPRAFKARQRFPSRILPQAATQMLLESTD